ncbi:hypothetical protein [Sphingomonas sp. 22R3R2A-7]|uniref:hypothetical protein n=1 Tax=Sphingomonas sp. 22R3R2A-7 TaxID=3050230 RepID=UPI002FDFAE80
MKDYSGLLEIAVASIGKNNDQQLRQDIDMLRGMIGRTPDHEQRMVADAIGKRILELSQHSG